MTDLFGLQVETIEAIIVALGTSFVGTGTVAMIVRLALNKVTKKLQEKVSIAEQQNKISSEQAKKAFESLDIFEQGVQTQIVVMQQTIDKLIENQRISNEGVATLLEEYKARDEQIKELIAQEFGEDDE
jgi:Holliday junction resolvasome RuvABC ATP-dependent DNA helicase subunit